MKKRKKYLCPLTGLKFQFAVDRDLCTELKQKELEAKNKPNDKNSISTKRQA